MHCSPVTTAVIRRPDSKYQLGFCVENGVVSAGDGSGAGRAQVRASAARPAEGHAVVAASLGTSARLQHSCVCQA